MSNKKNISVQIIQSAKLNQTHVTLKCHVNDTLVGTVFAFGPELFDVWGVESNIHVNLTDPRLRR